jgi:hypothetical protein
MMDTKVYVNICIGDSKVLAKLLPVADVDMSSDFHNDCLFFSR